MSDPEAPDRDLPSDESSDSEVEQVLEEKPKPALKKGTLPSLPEPAKTNLPEQPDPSTIDVTKLTPLSPEIIARQATINIGTIGHRQVLSRDQLTLGVANARDKHAHFRRPRFRQR